MANYIRTGKSVGQELIRIVDQRANKAQGYFDRDNDPDFAVHEARKQFKKIRAAWRLIRDDLGEKKYKKRNVFYRNIARKMSGLRDSKAILESLNQLNERFNDVLYKRAFDQAHDALLQRQKEIFSGDKKTLIQEVLNELEQKRKLINTLDSDINFPEKLVKSFSRVYERGYHHYLESKEKQNDEILHTWRKRAKYLRYQFHLLRGAWPSIFKCYESELHRLTNLLGDYNDLVMLKSNLRAARELLDERTLEVFFAISEYRQTALYESGVKLGRKLYSEKPASFQNRMKILLADNFRKT